MNLHNGNTSLVDFKNGPRVYFVTINVLEMSLEKLSHIIGT